MVICLNNDKNNFFNSLKNVSNKKKCTEKYSNLNYLFTLYLYIGESTYEGTNVVIFHYNRMRF